MPGQPHHVLYLTPWYPHRYDPMFGLFVERHARAAALRNKIYAIYCHADVNVQTQETDVTEEENYTAVRVYYPKSRTGIRVWDAFVNGARLFGAHRKALKYLGGQGVRIDLVHVHILTRVGLIAWWLKLTKGIPYLVTEHWSRYQPGKAGYEGWLRRLLTRLVVKNASVVTTVTEDLAGAMKAHQLRHPDYRIIYNVVDTKVFVPQSKSQRTIKKIIHISCFEEKSKNLSGIIRASAMLAQQRTDFVLEMVGEGHDREAAIALAKELGVWERFVRFPGLVEGEALGKMLADADFLIIFSHYENLPVVINEAMASGLPVVSSDVGGIREILTSGKGMLVKPGNEAAFAEALGRMLELSGTYDQRSIRRFAEEKFSIEAVSEYLDDLYREIISTK